MRTKTGIITSNKMAKTLVVKVDSYKNHPKYKKKYKVSKKFYAHTDDASKFQIGDLITIDIPNCRLHVNVSEEEFARRRENWSPPPKFSKGKGYLNVYTKLAQSANKGASWNYNVE